jgi:hypothetical protein
VQPIPQFTTAVQPIPPPVALPPTVSDEDNHGYVAGDDVPLDASGDRRARRRAIFARVLGVLGILATAAFAFVTVGRAWVSSLPSVVWPRSLSDRPELPQPLRPTDEPPLPAAPIEPPLVPPSEAAPPTPPAVPERILPEVPPKEPVVVPPPSNPQSDAQRTHSGRRPTTRERSQAMPAPTAPPMPAESKPDRGLEPEELPAPPSVDPAAPESPQIPADEGNAVFGSE